MLNDSVREELASKVTPIAKTVKTEVVETPKREVEITAPKVAVAVPIPPKPILTNRPQTSEIMTKTTSPTLVEFNNKNATLPDWRLQLQNSVRKRLDYRQGDESPVQTAPHRVNFVTNGATALKIEAQEVENEPIIAVNSTLEKALRRIEESRQRFLVTEVVQPEIQNTVKQFPQTFPNNSLQYLPKPDRERLAPMPAKPNLLQFSGEAKEEKFDTNKLPPVPPPAKISSSFEKRPIEYKKVEIEFEDDDFLDLHEVAAYQEPEIAEDIEQTEEIDDCAPISLRFNAAIFDLLIGSFLSLVLLSPFMLLNGRFFSLEGFFAFIATCSIVMFIYLTTTIGFLGRTFGMRIFSLEIIDIVENDYPTLHQAAVSSSVYLFSLSLGGIGFLTMLLNSEKRAAHDLLSKTIIVKEY